MSSRYIIKANESIENKDVEGFTSNFNDTLFPPNIYFPSKLKEKKKKRIPNNKITFNIPNLLNIILYFYRWYIQLDEVLHFEGKFKENL